MIVSALPHSIEANKKWSFLYAHNLKTIRDILVLVGREKLTREDLYKKMELKIIKPPKDEWGARNNKTDDRLKLEYFHAAVYLNLIYEQQGLLVPNFHFFKTEIESILKENDYRNLEKEKKTIELTQNEIDSLIPIILEYTRAKEYLYWFLSFESVKTIDTFRLSEFTHKGKAIFLKKEPNKKGAELIYRDVDSKEWYVPFVENLENGILKRSNDYSRLVTYTLPSWFEELRMVNRIPVLDEFGFKSGNWDMHYPISSISLSLKDFENFIEINFYKPYKSHIVIWIPDLIFKSARHYRLPISAIKSLIIQLYETKREKYLMERSSLQVLRYSKVGMMQQSEAHKNLFINYNGFLRNNLIINY